MYEFLLFEVISYHRIRFFRKFGLRKLMQRTKTNKKNLESENNNSFFKFKCSADGYIISETKLKLVLFTPVPVILRYIVF